MRERQLTPQTFYTTKLQTQTNKETNNNKQSHLIDRSSFITREGRTIERPQCTAARSNHSQQNITCLGSCVSRADKEVRQPIAVKARLSNLVTIYI